MASNDEFRDEIKAAFARDPERLVSALGLRVDERKSKTGVALWVYDGPEQEASLQIGGKPGMEGLCKRYGDDWGGDCFALVLRYRPGTSFRENRDFVAQLYGLTPPEKHSTHEQTAQVTGRIDYHVTRDGVLLGTHKRIDYADGSKRMWWEWPEDGERGDLEDFPLWGSTDLASKPTKAVVVCEGEKDADALREHGGLAVGTYGAEVIPSEAVLEPLLGRKVYLWPDNDAPGRKHMGAIARNLAVMGLHCYVVEWEDAGKGDGASDYFAAGLTVDGLRELLAKARPWALVFQDEEPTRENETALLAKIGEQVDASSYYADAPKLGAVPIAEIAGEIICNVEERRLLPRRIYGMRSGWPTLDWFFGGFRWQGLVVLAGDTGTSKTTIARHFIYATCEAIMREGSGARIPVYIGEGGREQFMRYFAGWKYGIPSQLIKPGSEEHMTDEWRDRLMQAYSEFAQLPIDLCDATMEADAILFDLERRASSGAIEGAVLDNVQLLEYPRGGNEWQNSKLSAKRAMNIADKYQFPFLVLTQVNVTGRDWTERGGPEWRNNATCRFFAERGESGEKLVQRGQSNLTVLHNLKARYEDGCCRPLRLRGDRDTGRLYEEDEYQRLFESATTTTGSREETAWHDN